MSGCCGKPESQVFCEGQERAKIVGSIWFSRNCNDVINVGFRQIIPTITMSVTVTVRPGVESAGVRGKLCPIDPADCPYKSLGRKRCTSIPNR